MQRFLLGCVVLVGLGLTSASAESYKPQRVGGPATAQSPSGERLLSSYSKRMQTLQYGQITCKYFIWGGPIRAGHCTLWDGHLRVCSNGYTDWWASPVSSTHNDDAWLATFTLRDRNNAHLFTYPRIASPTLFGGKWEQCCMYFPEYNYPYVAKAIMQSHC
jgi:hypothetical protein